MGPKHNTHKHAGKEQKVSLNPPNSKSKNEPQTLNKVQAKKRKVLTKSQSIESKGNGRDGRWLNTGVTNQGGANNYKEGDKGRKWKV